MMSKYFFQHVAKLKTKVTRRDASKILHSCYNNLNKSSECLKHQLEPQNCANKYKFLAKDSIHNKYFSFICIFLRVETVFA